jgi:hypothetical protein
MEAFWLMSNDLARTREKIAESLLTISLLHCEKKQFSSCHLTMLFLLLPLLFVVDKFMMLRHHWPRDEVLDFIS